MTLNEIAANPVVNQFNLLSNLASNTVDYDWSLQVYLTHLISVTHAFLSPMLNVICLKNIHKTNMI